jgi:hypothetical protein
MLTSLTFVTGTYSFANMLRMRTNRQLIINDKIKTFYGLRYIKQVNVIQDGMLYKMYFREKDCDICGKYEFYEKVYYGYTFGADNMINVQDFTTTNVKYFNTRDEYNQFCKEAFIDPDRYKYYKVKLEYTPVSKNDELWMICDVNSLCENLRIMKKSEYKKLLLNNHRLPLGLTTTMIFLCLIMYISYEYIVNGKI